MDSSPESISRENFPRICRTCALEGDLHSMFAYKKFSAYSLKIADILMEVANVQIAEGDELPLNMCTKCLSRLDFAYSFKLQCEQTNLKFHSYLSSIIVKEENDTDDSINFPAEHDLGETPDTRSGEEGSEPSKDCMPASETRQKIIKKRPTKMCPICNKSVSASFFPKHMRIHTGDRPHECHICGKGFIQKGTLVEHLRVHTGEKPYTCTMCGHSFGKSWNLVLHMKRHSDTEEPCKAVRKKNTKTVLIKCDICKQEFSSKIALKKHFISHKEKSFSCNECDKRFASSERLQTHKRLHTGDRPYSCPICGKSFVTMMYMKYHKQTHKAKMFLCNHCGKGFVRKAALQVHIRVHTGEKPYACSVCGKSFKQVGTLRAHEMVHSGERPYPCSFCEKSFRHINHLENHKRTHTGEKPFICVICSKQFAVKVNLTVHMRMHSGETPYKCPVCGKGFYDSSSMKKHHKGHINIQN